MKKIFLGLIIVSLFSFSSCQFFVGAMLDFFNDDRPRETCPENIRSYAYDVALEYEKAGAEYGWGAQDALRSIKVDCSGLVVRCYQYALQGSPYILPFDDASSTAMYEYYSTKTISPKRGDLIFMGDENSINVNHIGLLKEIKNNVVYFIDSTSLNDAGVSERSYQIDNRKIKGYGIMNVVRRW